MKGRAQLLANVIFLAFVLLSLPYLFAATRETQAPPVPELRAGGFGGDSVSSWPVYIAREKGFFAREGIKITFTRSYEQMAALIGGSFDVIDEAADAPILAADKGADIVVVYDISHRPSQFMVLGPGIQTPAELEGKIIGVWKIPSTDQLLLKKFLAKKGLDVNKIAFRRIGGSRDRFAALHAGQIGGTVLSTVYAHRAQQQGMKLTASPADWEIFPWTLIVFKKKWAEANTELVRKYVRAIHRGSSWLYDPANFEEAVRILTPISQFDEKAMRWSLEVSISNKIYNLEKPSPSILQLAADWLLAEGFLNKPFDATRLIDTRYFEGPMK